MGLCQIPREMQTERCRRARTQHSVVLVLLLVMEAFPCLHLCLPLFLLLYHLGALAAPIVVDRWWPGASTGNKVAVAVRIWGSFDAGTVGTFVGEECRDLKWVPWALAEGTPLVRGPYHLGGEGGRLTEARVKAV